MNQPIYRVATTEKLHFSDPLHVGNFYPKIQRHHPGKMHQRQDLILYLAHLHNSSLKSGKPPGFCLIPIRLMALRDWVHDYRVVLDHFFEVRQRGYNLGGDDHEISIITPRVLSRTSFAAASKAAENLTYVPPPLPCGNEDVVSKVFVKRENKDSIIAKLNEVGRLDLLAPVTWLLTRPSAEFNFYFARSGKLQRRDTSIWPIKAIETWPGWLREALFGEGIDIDSAYTQFLLEGLKEANVESPHLTKLLYPDLVRSLEDKAEWRREICVDLLGLDHTPENISVVKTLCMSLANGSRISPAILTGAGGFSLTRDIVIENAPNISISNLTAIGNRLSSISRQYTTARKVLCSAKIGLNATRKNQKLVFQSYFDWEREARYLIWEAVGRHGIMVHDAIDGVPKEYMKDIPALVKELNIRLT